jgi:hypothetical protein
MIFISQTRPPAPSRAFLPYLWRREKGKKGEKRREREREREASRLSDSCYPPFLFSALFHAAFLPMLRPPRCAMLNNTFAEERRKKRKEKKREAKRKEGRRERDVAGLSLVASAVAAWPTPLGLRLDSRECECAGGGETATGWTN